MTRDHGGVNIELLVAKNVRPPAQESKDRGKRQGREGDVVLFVGFSDDVAASRNRMWTGRRWAVPRWNGGRLAGSW